MSKKKVKAGKKWKQRIKTILIKGSDSLIEPFPNQPLILVSVTKGIMVYYDLFMSSHVTFLRFSKALVTISSSITNPAKATDEMFELLH